MNGIERNALHISMLSDYKAFIRILGLKQCTHYFFNPIPAGVHENQDMLGGVRGQFDPPPLNPMFDVQI